MARFGVLWRVLSMRLANAIQPFLALPLTALIGCGPSDPLPCAKKNWSEFELAIRDHNIEYVESFIQSGADINAPVGEFGDTPLHSAVGLGPSNKRQARLGLPLITNRLAIVKLLIENGANANATNYHDSVPLTDSIMTMDVEEAQLLLEGGADVNRVDRESFDHLSYAVRMANPDMVALLVENGADVNYRDAWGRTPLGVALAKLKDTSRNKSEQWLIPNFEEIIAILREKGATDLGSPID